MKTAIIPFSAPLGYTWSGYDRAKTGRKGKFGYKDIRTDLNQYPGLKHQIVVDANAKDTIKDMTAVLSLTWLHNIHR